MALCPAALTGGSETYLAYVRIKISPIRASSWFSDSKGDSRFGESLIPYVMRMTDEQDGSGLQLGFA